MSFDSSEIYYFSLSVTMFTSEVISVSFESSTSVVTSRSNDIDVSIVLDVEYDVVLE